MLRVSNYNGNEFIGVYSVANESISLVPMDSDSRLIEDIETALQVDCTKATISSTNLIGTLVAMNSYGVAITNFVSDPELEFFPKGLTTYRIEDKLNACGNNILVNDRGAIINPDMHPDVISILEEVFQVEVVPMTVAAQKTVGSVCVATDKGLVCHPSATKEEMEQLRSIFKVPVQITTLNYGSPFLGASIVANSKGGAVGFRSTPIELGRVEEALDIIS